MIQKTCAAQGRDTNYPGLVGLDIENVRGTPAEHENQRFAGEKGILVRLTAAFGGDATPPKLKKRHYMMRRGDIMAEQIGRAHV